MPTKPKTGMGTGTYFQRPATPSSLSLSLTEHCSLQPVAPRTCQSLDGCSSYLIHQFCSFACARPHVRSTRCRPWTTVADTACDVACCLLTSNSSSVSENDYRPSAEEPPSSSFLQAATLFTSQNISARPRSRRPERPSTRNQANTTMPRLKAVDDSAQDNGSRRSSGRARRPTAKIEALAGTKFYPSDSVKADRTGSASLSPGPSADSSFSTPMSPQSDSGPHGSQDQTSPSTISVQVISPSNEQRNKRAPSTPASDLQSSNQPATHSLRRERKPTQRALEMTETATKPRRRRRTQAEMAALRASATPSDISSIADAESPTTDRRSSLGQQDNTPSIPTKAAPLRTASRARRGDKDPDDPEPIASGNLLNKRTASKPGPRGRQTTLEHPPTDVIDSASPPKKKGMLFDMILCMTDSDLRQS